MSLSLGNTTIGSLYLGSVKVGEAYLGGTKVFSAGAPALAPRSMRFDFKYDHFNPITGLDDLSGRGLIWTHVANDVYDFHYDNADWGFRSTSVGNGGLFNLYGYQSGSSNVLPMTKHQFDVLDMDLTGVTTVSYLFNSAWPVKNIFSIRNTTSVTNFSYFVGHNKRTIAITSIPLFDMSSATNAECMFSNCTSLASVPLFNTSNVTNMLSMFANCTSLTSVPLFNTDSVTNVSYMFRMCTHVESGALALYQQMSTQTTPPTTHTNCFANCGSNTTTGAAELAQIPSDWGGTAT